MGMVHCVLSGAKSIAFIIIIATQNEREKHKSAQQMLTNHTEMVAGNVLILTYTS
jgi:hypothetical protein